MSIYHLQCNVAATSFCRLPKALSQRQKVMLTGNLLAMSLQCSNPTFVIKPPALLQQHCDERLQTTFHQRYHNVVLNVCK